LSWLLSHHSITGIRNGPGALPALPYLAIDKYLSRMQDKLLPATKGGIGFRQWREANNFFFFAKREANNFDASHDHNSSVLQQHIPWPRLTCYRYQS
jgi:hypothetical protein